MDQKGKWDNYLYLLRREVVPALGCTEPAAIGLAAARCAAEMGDGGDAPPDEMVVGVSRNILKNAMSVKIPGTALHGVAYAAALGFCGGDADRDLEVFAALGPAHIAVAERWVREGRVRVELLDTPYTICIDIAARRDAHSARCVVQGKHNHFVRVERDGRTVNQQEPLAEGDDGEIDLASLSLRGVYEFATQAGLETFALLREASRLNGAISDEGLQGEYGLSVGKGMQARCGKGLLGDDMLNRTIIRTTAAIDARMAGCSLPVMSNSGSGNQGITATVPVTVIAQELGADEETALRALVLSHMTAIYIKCHLSRLSALCGAIVASIGVSCAVVYLLGGGYDAMEKAVINMIADLTGMICDGAKAGCALKVSASIRSAFQAAMLAMEGRCVEGIEGIVADNAEASINNLATLATEGMQQTDRVILDIMVEKTGGFCHNGG